MSWLLNLYETYEANLNFVGKNQKKYNDQEYTLLPVSHTTQNAHIEVLITEDGDFHSATVIDKRDANTLIPCTEKSSSRAGAVVAPYPLHDKLPYVAGDFAQYSRDIKNENPFSNYIERLGKWAASPHAIEKVKIVHRYLSKGCLVEDLIQHEILYLDTNHRLIDKWDKSYEEMHGAKPAIYLVVAGGVESAFVRFNVYSPHRIFTEIWKDQEMHSSFVKYYSEQLGAEDLCYVTGKMLPSTERHANKIRNSADKAKLISANDTSGFTFRGRFHNERDVASISYEVSQKAHNALKWLIQRQGKVMESRVFLVWDNEDLDIPGLTEDLFAISPHVTRIEDTIPYTGYEFAREVSKALDGFRNNLSSKSDVNILVLDSATTGRMAVLYYRNMDKNLYIDRIAAWHSTCAWLHTYRKDENDQYVQFYGAPATKDIALAAYGPRASDKIVKGLMERILPCIVDEQRIPRDIVKSAFHRASNPVSMEKWEWEKTLSITCALINRQEEFHVALSHDNNDRDYLFGRLLAVADVLERQALGSSEIRATNAIRYMNSFSQHPARTWKTIQDCLQPYQAKLGIKSTYLSKIIDDVASRIPEEKFTNKPLSELYLLGFYSQRHELYQKKEKQEDTLTVSNQ